MKLRTLTLVIVIFVWLCSSSHTFAQSTTGRYLLLRPSAVSASMGGTGVALERSPFASYFNPAGLAYSSDISIAGSFVKPLPFFDNITHSYITASARLSDIGVIGVSGNLYWKGKHIRTGPGSLSSEDLMDWQVKVSYARSISSNLAAGINVGVLRLEVADIGTEQEEGDGKSTSMVFDAGVLYNNLFPATTITDVAFNELASAHSGVSLGLALSNLGPDVTMIDAQQADPLPTTLALGVAYSPIRLTSVGMMVTVDVVNKFSEGSTIDNIHWGGEVTVMKLVALRGGYFQDTTTSQSSYWSWGAGLRFRSIQINFARYTKALLPSWHFDLAFALEAQ